MKTEGKLPNEWSKDYSIEKENPPFSSDVDNTLNQGDGETRFTDDTEQNLEKMFAWNRGSFSGGPGPSLEEAKDKIRQMEKGAKAYTRNQSDEDGKQ